MRNVKGFPLWGWLVLLLVLAAGVWAISTGTTGSRCGPRGGCEGDF